MSDVETRLATLEAIEAIRRLKAAYCAACDDDHNGAAVAALFVEDGTWTRTDAEPCVGHDAIAAYMHAIRDAKFIRDSAHMVTNPVIDVDLAAGTATGAWRFTMMYTSVTDEFVRIVGHYEDTYRFVDGRWMFQSLMANVEQQH